MKLGLTIVGSGSMWFVSWILWDALKLWSRMQLSLFINVLYLLVVLCWAPLFASELRKSPKPSKVRKAPKMAKEPSLSSSPKHPFVGIAKIITEKEKTKL